LGDFAAENLRMKGEVSEGYLYGKEPAKTAAADLHSTARNNQLFSLRNMKDCSTMIQEYSSAIN
jgi:hypothetical protein